MATVEALVTLEKFAAMPNHGMMTELVRGKIVEVPPPGPKHGRICSRFDRLLGNFVEAHGLGEVMSNDTGIVTTRNPDSVLGADIVYYSTAKLPPPDRWDDYFELPPDLVAEVRSPSNRWIEMVRKAAEYLESGVLVVVVLDPDSRSVHIFEPDRPVRVLGPEDTLTFPDLLEGFSVPVARIFD